MERAHTMWEPRRAQRCGSLVRRRKALCMFEGVAGGSTESAETSASRPRMLVVDDDAALAEMLSIVLRNEGFEPSGARTGTRRSARSATPSPTWCCWT